MPWFSQPSSVTQTYTDTKSRWLENSVSDDAHMTESKTQPNQKVSRVGGGCEERIEPGVDSSGSIAIYNSLEPEQHKNWRKWVICPVKKPAPMTNAAFKWSMRVFWKREGGWYDQ